MSEKNDNAGCIAMTILLVCGLIAGFMFLTWALKGTRDLLKESPGGVFVAVVIIGILAYSWLNDSFKH